MERKDDTSTNSVFRREQQPRWPTPPSAPTDAIRALQQAQEQVTCLLSENFSLKLKMERYTSDRISWENQKKFLIQEISGLHRILEERGLCPVQDLRASERSSQCPGPTEQKGEATTLYETLCARVEETELILARWQEHHDKAKAAWQEENDKVQTAYENGWRAVRADLEMGKAAEFRARCEELEVGMKKKDRVIARFQSQLMALGKEHLLNVIQLSRMKELFNQREEESKLPDVVLTTVNPAERSRPEAQSTYPWSGDFVSLSCPLSSPSSLSISAERIN